VPKKVGGIEWEGQIEKEGDRIRKRGGVKKEGASEGGSHG